MRGLTLASGIHSPRRGSASAASHSLLTATLMRSSRPLFGLSLLATLVFAACQTGGRSASSGSGSQASDAMPAANGPAVQAASMIQAGEYLTTVGGCNDCHTQNWVESKGKVAPADRFAGMSVGFRGPWGTTYGKNLRTIVQRMSEDRWVKVLQTADSGDGRPPMPWWNTAQMSDRDLRAMYRYVKSLGPKPNGVPRGLPPEKEPTGPYMWLTTSREGK
jgi:mono/diheme cytochrome c family protein